VTDFNHQKELSLKGSSKILGYLRQFSATEKTVFGLLAIVAGVTAITMAFSISNYFLVEVPAFGGELREGVVGLPHTINPVLAVTDVDRDISALVFSGLMKYSGENLVPDLAASYNISPDGLSYTFNLKKNLYFHDGTELTAEDVAFTIQKIQDPALKSPRNADWKDVSVTVVSPSQIKFNLKQAYSPFLTNTVIGILPKHLWSSVSNEQFNFNERNIETIGSGPYREEVVNRDSKSIPTIYKLTSFGDYYGPKPFLENISFHFFTDNESALAALENGQIDSLAAVSPEAATKLAGNQDQTHSYNIISSTLPRIFGIFFNQVENPVLSDAAVRQALSQSIDRGALVKSVLGNFGEAIDGPLPDGLLDQKPASSQTATSGLLTLTGSINTGNATDTLSLARAILEKAGWKKNPSTGIYEKKGTKNSTQILSLEIFTADTPDLKEVADLVKKTWTSLGATVSVKIFEPADLYQNVIRTRKYDALLFGELIGKDRDIYAFWHSSQRTPPRLNISMYTNSKVDKLLEEIRATSDQSTRMAKYQSLNQLIKDDFPAAFLYSPDFIYVVPSALKRISLNDITLPSDRFNSVENWYMKTQKVWKIFANNNHE